MKKFAGLLVIGFGCSLATNAQNHDSSIVKQIADEILTNSYAYENLRFLCKQIGPRLSGSDNAAKAVLATANMLREAGADTVYLQPCMVTHWERGAKEQGYIMSNDGSKYDLHLCALGNSVATEKDGLLKSVIEIHNFEELERLGESFIKGKIVFFNFPMNPKHVNTFEAYRESGKYRTRGPATAARYGAAAVMVRSLASNVDDYPHTGTTIYNDSFPKIPAVAISTKDAEWLSNQLREKMEMKVWLKTNCRLLDDAPSFNVIAEIKGKVFPEQIIDVGGHLDSWDLGEGAQDDGAGCVQSIEVIRAFNALHIIPKRTIRAVMFMNEENGTKGARAYAAAAAKDKEQHIFALESDEGGFAPRGFSLEMKKEQAQKIMLWKNILAPYHGSDITEGESGSDIGFLKQTGTALAGFKPDSQRYFDLHHAATDRFEAVSKRELDLGAVNITAMIWLVSEYGL